MKKKVVILVGIIVLLFIAVNSIYVIQPDEVAIVQRFGKITHVVVKEEHVADVKEQLLQEPSLRDVKVLRQGGLLFKVPFVDQVTKETGKYLTYTSRQETINTRDNRKIDIEMYAQYRIYNPALYKMRAGSLNRLNQLIDDSVYPVVVQSANKLSFDQFFDDEKMQEVMDEKREELNQTLSMAYGVEIIDVGIYRKAFPLSTISSIEEKMSKEIQKESERLIAEGDAYYVKSTSQTDRIEKEIIAEAVEESALIRAEGDKEAMRIYNEALSKDIEFYKFMQRMDAYQELEGTTIFVDPENQFLQYLNGY